MLRENQNPTIYGLPVAIGITHMNERLVVAQFAAKVNALGSLSQASWAVQARILEEVKMVARRIDGSVETGKPSGYDRRVLYEVPGRWSLAAVILRPGQQTELHDHGGWGCAVTVQGLERDRRFVHDTSGEPVLVAVRDYGPGAGYVFDAVDIHQPVGADPGQVTVALHFLVHDSPHHNAHPEKVEASSRHLRLAA